MTVLASLVAAALAAGPAGASEAAAKPAQPKPQGAAPQAQPARKAPEAEVQANTPPFSEGIFPCSGCHDAKDKVDHTPRELQMHGGPGEPAAVLQHGSERWCLDCHDAQRRDLLRSASGQPIPFTESYRLCGQCHGDKYRDWKVGVHGKRTGMWDGAKTYFLCVNCHNPHTPRWKGVDDRVVDGKRVVSPTLELLRPEPVPVRPEQMRMTPDQLSKAAASKAPAKEAHP
jgi:hypothetical protein